MNKTTKLWLTLGVLGTMCQGQAVAFVNGDFETGDRSGWDFALTPNGNVRFEAVLPFDMNYTDPGGISNAARFSVGQIDDTLQQAGIRLTQMLTLEAGVTYNISYKWAAENTFPTFSNFDGGTFQLVVNDQILNSHATEIVDSMVTEYGVLSAQFTPSTTGDYEIGSQIIRRFKVPFFSEIVMAQYVDDFEIEAVPEPATLTLLTLSGVLILRRKK